MASSFADQIPMVMYLIRRLGPKTVLDIGKGFGKYGFLVHEYCGVPWHERPDPAKTLGEQSRVAVDAVEAQGDYLWPHIEQLYRETFIGDIGELYDGLHGYDLVLMADVIEHLPKEVGLRVARHFVQEGSAVLITTPKDFFHQELFESEYEQHRSLWTPEDFAFAPYMDWQYAGPGRIYLLANKQHLIAGFGNRPLTRARRVAGFLRDEFGFHRGA